MGTERRTFTVDETRHRLRLDRFLRSVCPDLGRHALQRLLRAGAVIVEGRPRDASYFVKRGQWIEVTLEATPPAIDEPREILRSSQILAVMKPPGWATNPVAERSLLAWAESRSDSRPGLVHRLDRDTSGAVLFSLTGDAYRILLRAFRARRIEKRYLALVAGPIRPRSGTIDRPLRRDASGRMMIDPTGVSARTAYKVVRSNRRATLVELIPKTGRMHQIRVHLASMGHPICGDPRYGDPRRDLEAPRLWLHAASIRLPAETARLLEAPALIEAPLWDDLAEHLASLGIRYEARKA